MATEEFLDNLRRASRLLARPRVHSERGSRSDDSIASALDAADLWLSPRSVEGFSIEDFDDLPAEAQTELSQSVDEFLSIARQVPKNQPATIAQSKQARQHLQRVIQIVRDSVLHEWLEAQDEMVSEATAAANAKGWFVERDEKEVHEENFLGTYSAPRLRIRAKDHEVVLDPITRFGVWGRGIVDLVVLPRYETACLITLDNDHWKIVAPEEATASTPFNQQSFIEAVLKLSRR